MISSTVLDLTRHRDVARDVCLRLRMLPLMMEHQTARAHGAIEESLRLVDNADVYVGVFGNRYGYRVDGSPSITELEYERAVARAIPVLAFLVEDGEVTDETDDSKARLAALKDRVRRQWVVPNCPTLSDFRENLFLALEPYRREERVSPHFVSDIPAPPRPYEAHPYTLLRSDQLVGRTRELAAISEWAADRSREAPAILIVVAIGGSGKSAMTWKWFNESAAQSLLALAGRIWWSFYESDATFENFVIRALSYVMVIDRDSVRRLPPREREERLLNFLSINPFVVVLDGIERLLTAYARTTTAADADAPDPNDELHARSRGPRLCLDPHAGAFLQKLSRAHASRTLISSRLIPADLETNVGEMLPGVRVLRLHGLTDQDAHVLAQSAGVQQVSRQMAALFRQFDNYPLLIRALAGEVANHRPAPGDFEAWLDAHPDFDPTLLPMVRRKMHVLEFALRGLSWSSARVLQVVSSFRMPAPYENLAAILIGQTETLSGESHLDRALADLEERGLVGWERRGNRYDVHPVIRSVIAQHFGRVAQRLVDENTRQYLQSLAVAKETELRTLDDLAVPIELFHTLVRLGQPADAYEVFLAYLYEPALTRLNLCREAAQWLAELFPEGPEGPSPGLSEEAHRRALWDLTFTYQKTGLLQDAVRLWRLIIPLTTHPTSLCRAYVSLGRALTYMGSLREAEEAFRKALLAQPVLVPKDVVTIGYRLADLLALRGVSKVPETLYRKAVELGHHMLGEEHAIAAHVVFAHQLLRKGKVAEAGELLVHGRTLVADMSLVRSVIELQSLAGHIDLARRDFHEAMSNLEAAVNAARSTQYVAIGIEALIALARAQSAMQDLPRALGTLEEAISLARRHSFRLLEAEAHLRTARIRLAMNDGAGAADAAAKAARLAWGDGEPSSAVQLSDEARSILKALGRSMPLLPAPLAPREELPHIREISLKYYGVEIS